MPIFNASLSDGRTVTLEADQAPSDDQVLQAVQTFSKEGLTAPLAETQAEQEESASMLRGEGKPETGMEPGTGLVTEIGKQVKGGMLTRPFVPIPRWES